MAFAGGAEQYGPCDSGGAWPLPAAHAPPPGGIGAAVALPLPEGNWVTPNRWCVAPATPPNSYADCLKMHLLNPVASIASGLRISDLMLENDVLR